MSKYPNHLIILLALLICMAVASCKRSSQNSAVHSATAPGSTTSPNTQTEFERQLENELGEISNRARASVGIAVVHVESGRRASLQGSTLLPLYSVFKLPLAITVLREVEANRVKLDQKVHVTPEETVPGTPENTSLWTTPVDRTVAELIELSISRSDNTSTEKLLELIGGPQHVTDQMRTLGFQNIDIHSSVMDFVKKRQNQNTGSAEDLANLLTQLQQGKILQPAHNKLLIGYMQRATTGLKRLRGGLPSGTMVADKTGSGERNPQTNVPKATNDVGIITLPNGRGNLAMAVLVSESSLPDVDQEKLIAELARAAYDAFSKEQRK
jgi:beta-lactamase class A